MLNSTLPFHTLFATAVQIQELNLVLKASQFSSEWCSTVRYKKLTASGIYIRIYDCVIIYEMCTESFMCSHSVWWFWSDENSNRSITFTSNSLSCCSSVPQSFLTSIQSSLSLHLSSQSCITSINICQHSSSNINGDAGNVHGFLLPEGLIFSNWFVVNYTGCVQNGILAYCTVYTAYIFLNSMWKCMQCAMINVLNGATLLVHCIVGCIFPLCALLYIWVNAVGHHGFFAYEKQK